MSSAPPAFKTFLIAWLLASATFAASGALAYLPGLAIPAMIWGLALSALAWILSRPDVRQFLAHADLGPAFVLQALRAPVGAGFLLLKDELDPGFVAIAGPGDIIAGAGAVLAWGVWRLNESRGLARWIVLGWNTVALIDILMVMFTAAQVMLFGGGIAAMQGFLRFPMPMIPSLLVPLILLTHLWIFVRVGWPHRPPFAGGKARS